MVWHHPTVREIDILLELDGEHLRIDLDDRPFQPITNTFSTKIMITKNLDQIAYAIGLFTVWC